MVRKHEMTSQSVSKWGVDSILSKNPKPTLFLDKKGRPLDFKVLPHAVDSDELANIRELIKEARLHENFPQRLETYVEADPSTVARLRGLAGALPAARHEEVPVTIVEADSSLSHVDVEVSMATNRRSYTARPVMLVVDTIGDAHFHYADISIPLSKLAC